MCACARPFRRTSSRSSRPVTPRPWRAVARCEIGAYLRGSAYEPRLMHFPASEEITDFLLARGEDINSRDRYQRTPIHARVQSRCLDQIPLLIARGGDINARDTSDQTALFGVVERFPVADVSRMIAWGADPLVVADSRVYGKATLVENVVAWHNFLDTPRALAVIRLLLSVEAPVGERVPTALHVHHARAARDDFSGDVRRGLGCVVGAVRAVRGGTA